MLSIYTNSYEHIDVRLCAPIHLYVDYTFTCIENHIESHIYIHAIYLWSCLFVCIRSGRMYMYICARERTRVTSCPSTTRGGLNPSGGYFVDTTQQFLAIIIMSTAIVYSVPSLTLFFSLSPSVSVSFWSILTRSRTRLWAISSQIQKFVNISLEIHIGKKILLRRCNEISEDFEEIMIGSFTVMRSINRGWKLIIC